MKRLSWPYGGVFCSVVLIGTVGALYLTDRLVGSSSWPRELVFLSMLPALLAPTIIVVALLEVADRKFGLKGTRPPMVVSACQNQPFPSCEARGRGWCRAGAL
jgi:hypothetical protein